MPGSRGQVSACGAGGAGVVSVRMWEAIQLSSVWGGVGVGAAWFVTVCLLVAGAVGCVLPSLPGHLILIIAAVAHRLMLGREGSGLEWWSFVILVGLAAVSQTFETLSGAAGTGGSGGTHWGALARCRRHSRDVFHAIRACWSGRLIGAFALRSHLPAKNIRNPPRSRESGPWWEPSWAWESKWSIGVVMIRWFFMDVLFDRRRAERGAWVRSAPARTPSPKLFLLGIPGGEGAGARCRSPDGRSSAQAGGEESPDTTGQGAS